MFCRLRYTRTVSSPAVAGSFSRMIRVGNHPSLLTASSIRFTLNVMRIDLIIPSAHLRWESWKRAGTISRRIVNIISMWPTVWDYYFHQFNKPDGHFSYNSPHQSLIYPSSQYFLTTFCHSYAHISNQSGNWTQSQKLSCTIHSNT